MEEQIITTNIIKKESFTLQDRINMIIELDKKIISIYEQVKGQKWDSLKDSRMLFIRYIIELNSITILQFSFQADAYSKTSDREWLKSCMPHLSKQIDGLKDIDLYSANRNKNIASQVWDTYILNYFGEFETRIRSIVRNLKGVVNLQKTKKPTYLSGNEPFYWVYRGLFENYLRMEKEKYEVLKFFSAIRNTIHNSGFYFTINKEDNSYNYRGKTYHFKYGKPISFLDSKLKFSILADLLDLFHSTIRHSKIWKLELIKDPVSRVIFE